MHIQFQWKDKPWKTQLSTRKIFNNYYFFIFYYLFGSSLIGKGDVLPLFIAAICQDVDDGDLIHTYKDTRQRVREAFLSLFSLYQDVPQHSKHSMCAVWSRAQQLSLVSVYLVLALNKVPPIRAHTSDRMQILVHTSKSSLWPALLLCLVLHLWACALVFRHPEFCKKFLKNTDFKTCTY